MPTTVPPAAPPPPRRLPGRVTRLGWTLVRRSSALWLTADELVQIDTVFWTEKTRRFAYTGIQAVLLRETTRGLILSLVFGGLAAVFGLLAWAMNVEALHIFFGSVASGSLALLIYNAIRGGTCRCTLLTALGPHPLPSLNRRRPAHKALRLITERVDAAQGAPGGNAP